MLTDRPVDGVDIPIARNILAYNMKRSVLSYFRAGS